MNLPNSVRITPARLLVAALSLLCIPAMAQNVLSSPAPAPKPIATAAPVRARTRCRACPCRPDRPAPAATRRSLCHGHRNP
jgi:hypothetical protein